MASNCLDHNDSTYRCKNIRLYLLGIALVFSLLTQPLAIANEIVRIGIIGCDTSHVPLFTKLLNADDAQGALAKVEVVAVFPDFSPDVPLSRDRVEMFTEQLREMGIEVTDSVDSLLDKVDAVMIENVDGRKHLQHARAVFGKGKPVFIDKPLGGSLADVLEIFDLAKATNTPCFTSSSFSLLPEYQAVRNNTDIGDVNGCMVYGLCEVESYLPDLFWYGIHGVDIMFEIMGTGCERVSRVQTEDADLVVGVWKDRRIGTYRGLRTAPYDFGAIVYGSKSNYYTNNIQGYGYPELMQITADFFTTGKVPVSEKKTIEVYAFMEAADESKRKGGQPVDIAFVINKARAEVAQRQKE